MPLMTFRWGLPSPCSKGILLFRVYFGGPLLSYQASLCHIPSSFCSILCTMLCIPSCSILCCAILLYACYFSILFHSILCLFPNSIPFYSIEIILFISILCYSVLFNSRQLSSFAFLCCALLFCSILCCSPPYTTYHIPYTIYHMPYSVHHVLYATYYILNTIY